MLEKSQKKYAPVLISVYNRLKHLEKCVDSLKSNEFAKFTDLYIVSDAPYKKEDNTIVFKIREYINSIKGFNSVKLIANKNNLGASRSIGNARNKVLDMYDILIIMEDDNIVSPHFLTFINEMLAKYEADNSIYSICGYNFRINISDNYPYDIYFYRTFCAWGFGIWKNKYVDISSDTFQINDKSAIRKYKKMAPSGYEVLKHDMETGDICGDARIGYLLHKNNQYCVFPIKTLVTNIGHDGSGRHCGISDVFINHKFTPNFLPNRFPPDVSIDKEIQRKLRKYWHVSYYLKVRRFCGQIFRFIKRLLICKK